MRPHAAPFVLIYDFLPREARDAMWDFLLARSKEFVPAQMDTGMYADVRRTSFLGNCLNGLEDRWRKPIQDRLTSAFRAALPQLGVADFVPLGTEMHGLIYRHGDFFRAHQDDEPGGSRAVTFVYNMHREPKAFSGGELLLYDTDEEGYAPTHTRLAPEDNRLILFPSSCFHEVVAVEGAVEDRDARIAVNGWFHRKAEG